MTKSGIVPYDPAAARRTRSQIASTPYAVAKDLISRLDAIPIGDAEATLASRTRRFQPDCSLLSYLREPGDGITPALAAVGLLEELADGVEDVSTTTALVVRYVQAHRLWESHPNPEIDSLETLLGAVDGVQYVQAAAVVGTSSQFMRARTAVLISQHWDPDWFERIPAEMKDPAWTRACDCSHQLLRLIAANAKRLPLEEACRGWAESIGRRRDERIRKEMRMRSPRSPFIIPEDVRSLNKITDPAQLGRRTTEVFYPDEAAEDQLRVELLPPSAKRDYSGFGPSRARVQKRRRTGVGGESDRARDDGSDATVGVAGAAADDGWRPSKDGKWLLKRTGRQMVRKPAAGGGARPPTETGTHRDPLVVSPGRSTSSSVDASEDGDVDVRALAESLPERAADGADQHPVGVVGKPIAPVKCEGRRVAAVLRYLVDALSAETGDAPAIVGIAGRCCDTCSSDVAVLDGLVRDLTRVARSLESVPRHRLAGVDIGCSQPCGTAPSTPRRDRRRHHWLPVADDSDDTRSDT
jgi:hypothetical protein